MRMRLGALIAVSVAGAIGVSVFSIGTATSNPFGAGYTPPTCGENLSCASADFAATASSGNGFSCTAALAECFDPGPGTCNEIGTNGSGQLVLGGTDCNPDIVWGDSSRIQGNTWTNTNGAIVCNNGCFLVNQTGTEPVKITDAHGIAINGGTAITKHLHTSASLNFGSIAAGATASLTVTMTGARDGEGEQVNVTADCALEADIGVDHWYVSDADTVTVRVRNHGAGAVDPAACTYVVGVWK
jgi:hypothetical protein